MLVASGDRAPLEHSLDCIIFLPVTGLKCSYGKIFSLRTEIPIGKTEILATKLAHSLIRTHPNFYKGCRGEARSRKLGQPAAGQLGSY